MKDINTIYYNDFGIAFQWKKETLIQQKKIQIVFRDTGFLLSQKELIQFSQQIKCTLSDNYLCDCCAQKESCRVLLLETPVSQVSLAVSKKELKAIEDLIAGTIFQLNLGNYLDEICLDN